MNEELKNQLSTFLAKALDVAEKGIESTGEQIPMILQEIVYWEMSQGFLCLLLAIPVAFLLKNLIKTTVKQFKKNEPDYILVGTFAIITCTVLIGLIFMSSYIIKSLIAPRLVILEYLKGLL